MRSRTGVTSTMAHKYKKDQTRGPWSQVNMILAQPNNISSDSSSTENMDLVPKDDALGIGSCNSDVVNYSCGNKQTPTQGDNTEYSTNDLCTLPEICVSSNSGSFEENMSSEVQQAYRIFTVFLLEKHKALATPFLKPIGNKVAQHGGVCRFGQTTQNRSICLPRIEEKFVQQEYKSITEFVADFRIMLENCYRFHGVDHWISKQAQKLEVMLEQKLTLLSRSLREKTTLAVTSKGQFGAEEERVTGGTSTRRRSAPRNLSTTVGGHESVMVQVLRMEEQQKAKEEKRQRELDKKEAEEMSAKEVEEWEQSLLMQASPSNVDTLWELPAIGHFLCLAQSALNLPEIVFYELERCLLMPRCSSLLAKVMSSLLSPWQRRATLHRRPTLPYSRWESELRQRVLGWYRAVGSSRDQPTRAEQLGLCHQFFIHLGDVSPLEETPFHLLPFHQRVWLMKGLCDNVYETQKDIRDAVLAQPIHECRESILGYDGKENAYIHFPHFCGSDLRVYRQSPSRPPAFPFPSVWVKKIAFDSKKEDRGLDEMMARVTGDGYMDTDHPHFEKGLMERSLSRENGIGKKGERSFELWPVKQEDSDLGSERDSSEDAKRKRKNDCMMAGIEESMLKIHCKNEAVESTHRSKKSKINCESDSATEFDRTIRAETNSPCLSVDMHSYTGHCPVRSPDKLPGIKSEEGISNETPQGLPSDCSQNKSEKGLSERVWTKKKLKKKRRRQQLLMMRGVDEQLRPVDGVSLCLSDEEAATGVTTMTKRKDKKKHKPGKKPESARSKKGSSEEPTFKLVCANLVELRTLISKIEDELDELESTKNHLGRWFYRREAVKELHSTLIRLLNELLPWEPKLVKAFQRNRISLKKEFDDFKKHPDYNSFSREECASTSSSSEEEKDSGKTCLSLDHMVSEDDLEHAVPRGLGIGATNRDGVAEYAERIFSFPNNLQLNVASTKSISPLSSVQSSCSNFDSQDFGPFSTHGELPNILHSTVGLPKGYTPIPTLLARSVGNKVTLMKRPIDCTVLNNVHRHGKLSSVSLTTSAVVATTFPEAQRSPHNSQQPHRQERLNTVPIDLLKPSEPKSPAKVVHKVAEGLGQLLSYGGDTSGKVKQQVVILPPKLLVQKPEQNMSHLHKEVPVSNTPLCLTTNVPGFTIPDTSICSQQEAITNDASKMHSRVMKGISLIQGMNKTPPPSPSVMSPISRPGTTLEKQPEPKQELKTICIRDSQSILVTTRGGNTGIVRVQTSANSFNNFSSGPVITLSPQINAFILSKMCQTLSTTSSTSSASTPAVTSTSKIQNKDSKELNNPTTHSTPTVPTSSVCQSPYTSFRPATAKVKDHAQAASHQSDLNVNSTNILGKSPSAKFFLMTPSSLPSSSSHATTAALSQTNGPTSTRVMLLNQSTLPPASSSVVPNQVKASGGPLLKTCPSSLKMGAYLERPTSGENADDALCCRSFTLPTGLQVQLSGKTTTIGQSIGALSRSVSLPGISPATPARLMTSSVASCSAPLSFRSTLTSVPTVSSSSLSVASSETTGMLPTVYHSAQSSSIHHPFVRQQTSQTSVPSPVVNRPQSQISPEAPAASTVQQRIVINTATPLAAGTQIFLNNTRYIVPPQGLGPGNHVLIISNPSSHQVPSVHAMLPHPGLVRVAPQAPVLSRPPTLQLSTGIGSSFVVPTNVRPPNPQPKKVKPFALCASLNNTQALGHLQMTNPPVLTSTLATIRLRAGSPPPVVSSPTTLPEEACVLSPPAAAMFRPGQASIPIPVIPDVSYVLSHPHMQEATEAPQQQAAGKIAATPLQPYTFVGVKNIKEATTLLQPILARAGTQPVPMATPIVSTETKIQTIGTVLQRAPAATSLSPTIDRLRTSDSSPTPIALTNLQSASGINQNVASKLLSSADRAMFSTVQCQINPENVTTNTDAPSSATGACF